MPVACHLLGSLLYVDLLHFLICGEVVLNVSELKVISRDTKLQQCSHHVSCQHPCLHLQKEIDNIQKKILNSGHLMT